MFHPSSGMTDLDPLPAEEDGGEDSLSEEEDGRDTLSVQASILLRVLHLGSTHLFLKTLTGESLTIPFAVNGTVETFKSKIEALEGTPIHQQRIIFAGEQLEDDRTFHDYGIKHHYTLHLVLRYEARVHDTLPALLLSASLQSVAGVETDDGGAGEREGRSGA